MFRKLKLPAMLLIVAAFTAPLIACNTIEGVGKDVEAAGDAVEDAAERNRAY